MSENGGESGATSAGLSVKSGDVIRLLGSGDRYRLVKPWEVTEWRADGGKRWVMERVSDGAIRTMPLVPKQKGTVWERA